MAKLPKLPTSSDRSLWETRLSIFHYPAVTVSHQMGLFELLKGKALSAQEIANPLAISLRGASVLTNILWGLGFLELTQGRFKLSGVAKDYALTDSHFSWGNVFSLFGDKAAHQELLTALKKDGSTIQFQGKAYTDMWESGSIDAEAAAVFTGRMHSYIFAPALGAAKTGIFKNLRSLLDVGGGSGAFCMAVAAQNRKMKAAVYDLPAVCKVAENYINQFGFSKRVQTIEGNFCKDPLPSGHDGILFSNIFHDWGPERCRQLAVKAFEALPKNGKIFLHEMVFDPSIRGPLAVSCFSMLMFLGHPGGQQYSEAELKAFLMEAGFKKVKSSKAFGYYSIVSAVKP